MVIQASQSGRLASPQQDLTRVNTSQYRTGRNEHAHGVSCILIPIPFVTVSVARAQLNVMAGPSIPMHGAGSLMCTSIHRDEISRPLSRCLCTTHSTLSSALRGNLSSASNPRGGLKVNSPDATQHRPTVQQVGVPFLPQREYCTVHGSLTCLPGEGAKSGTSVLCCLHMAPAITNLARHCSK